MKLSDLCRFFAKASLAALVAAVVSAPAAANDKSVCEDVRYGTPGLYGLCIAYCLGADCDAQTQKAAACKPPRESILSNYDKKKQEGDSDMPCRISFGDSQCPCFTANDLQDLGLDPSLVCSPPDTMEGGQFLRIDGAACSPNNVAGAADYVIGGDGVENTCFYRRVDTLDCSEIGSDMADATITEAQADHCFQLLLDFCGPYAQ